MDYKISKLEYAEFEKHYAWTLLSAPDYRLGQAFVNYFPEAQVDAFPEVRLFFEPNNETSQTIINTLIEL